jgi:hypothetical protein
MTIFIITESHDEWHNFSTHITDDQKAYAEYMICAASSIIADQKPISIKVEIAYDKMLSKEMKKIYKKAGILLEREIYYPPL